MSDFDNKNVPPEEQEGRIIDGEINKYRDEGVYFF